MFSKSIFLPRPRLFARICLLLFLIPFSLTACYTRNSCEACGPPPGYNPDPIPLLDANGILYSVIHTTLYAVQDHSGKLLWQYTNSSLDHDAPVVSDGVIYLDMDVVDTSDSNQVGKWVYALSGSTGQVLWHTRIATSSQQFSTPEPVVSDGMVYVEESGANYGSTLFALRASDGKIAWSESPRGSNGESVNLLLASAGVAYLDSYSSNTGYVLARRASDGALLWQYSFSNCNVSASPIVNDTLYVTAFCGNVNEGVDAFQADTGKLLWSFLIPTDSLIAVTPTRTVVYVDGGANPSPGTDRFFALDANTGQLLWKREIPQASAATDTRIWAADESAVYTTINGAWYALGARDGNELWKMSAGAYWAWSPVFPANMQPGELSDNLVYLRRYDQVDAFLAHTGKLSWKLSLPTGTLAYSVTFFQKVVYLTEMQRVSQPEPTKTLYAIQADTGKVLWHRTQTPQPQVMTQDGVYFSTATGKPYHYTYHITALQSSSGKQMWTFQV